MRRVTKGQGARDFFHSSLLRRLAVCMRGCGEKKKETKEDGKSWNTGIPASIREEKENRVGTGDGK